MNRFNIMTFNIMSELALEFFFAGEKSEDRNDSILRYYEVNKIIIVI